MYLCVYEFTFVCLFVRVCVCTCDLHVYERDRVYGIHEDTYVSNIYF